MDIPTPSDQSAPNTVVAEGMPSIAALETHPVEPSRQAVVPLNAPGLKLKSRILRSIIRFELWLGLANLLLAGATAWLALTNNNLQRQSALSDENQRAVEATLQLQTFWNELLDDSTREKLLRVVTWIDSMREAGEDPAPHVAWLAQQKRIGDPKATDDVWIRKLLGSDHQTTAADATHQLVQFRSATLRVLNALQAVANLRSVTKSEVTSKVIDDTYRDVIQYRLGELMPFIQQLRAESAARATVFQPLTAAFEANGVWREYLVAVAPRSRASSKPSSP